VKVCVGSLRTDGGLKAALLYYKLRHLFVLTLCGIIELHGYAVHLFSAFVVKKIKKIPAKVKRRSSAHRIESVEKQ